METKKKPITPQFSSSVVINSPKRQEERTQEITCTLTNNFLAGCDLYRGDRVCIERREEVDNYELALVKVGEYHFIAYVSRRADESLDLFGPDSLEPVQSYDAGEYEIIGPVVRQIVPLADEQRRMHREPAQIIKFRR